MSSDFLFFFYPVFQGPTFTADTVFGRNGFLLGAEAAYNVTEGRLTRYSGAIGFSAPDYAVALHSLGGGSTFAASYYHRVSPDVEAGAKAIYDTKAPIPSVNLEVGVKTCVVPVLCPLDLRIYPLIPQLPRRGRVR